MSREPNARVYEQVLREAAIKSRTSLYRQAAWLDDLFAGEGLAKAVEDVVVASSTLPRLLAEERLTRIRAMDAYGYEWGSPLYLAERDVERVRDVIRNATRDASRDVGHSGSRRFSRRDRVFRQTEARRIRADARAVAAQLRAVATHVERATAAIGAPAGTGFAELFGDLPAVQPDRSAWFNSLRMWVDANVVLDLPPGSTPYEYPRPKSRELARFRDFRVKEIWRAHTKFSDLASERPIGKAVVELEVAGRLAELRLIQSLPNRVTEEVLSAQATAALGEMRVDHGRELMRLLGEGASLEVSGETFTAASVDGLSVEEFLATLADHIAVEQNTATVAAPTASQILSHS